LEEKIASQKMFEGYSVARGGEWAPIGFMVGGEKPAGRSFSQQLMSLFEKRRSAFAWPGSMIWMN
jgi:hypothetical protein